MDPWPAEVPELTRTPTNPPMKRPAETVLAKHCRLNVQAGEQTYVRVFTSRLEAAQGISTRHTSALSRFDPHRVRSSAIFDQQGLGPRTNPGSVKALESTYSC